MSIKNGPAVEIPYRFQQVGAEDTNNYIKITLKITNEFAKEIIEGNIKEDIFKESLFSCLVNGLIETIENPGFKFQEE